MLVHSIIESVVEASPTIPPIDEKTRMECTSSLIQRIVTLPMRCPLIGVLAHSAAVNSVIHVLVTISGRLAQCIDQPRAQVTTINTCYTYLA